MVLNKTFIKKYKNPQPLHVSTAVLQPKKTAAVSTDLKEKGCTENLRGKETHSKVKLGKVRQGDEKRLSSASNHTFCQGGLLPS